MAPPVKSAANPTPSHGSGADPSRENPPSNILWIGNVSPDISETELKVLFEKYGKVDSIYTYPSRNYAFVYFKEIEGAKSGKQGLQGHVLRGNPLRIEFAKPAKPCKSLWVAGISQSISKEELEKEFLRFGKIQEFRFLRDRNTAYVDYVALEDATQALKNLNGKRIGGAQLRVDYLRSQSSKREQGPDMGTSDFRWMGPDSLHNYPEPGLSGSKGKNAKPCKCLWVGGISQSVSKEELEKEFLRFGQIQEFRFLRDRNTAYVDYVVLEDATQALKILNGKRIGGAQLRVDYLRSQSSRREQGPDMGTSDFRWMGPDSLHSYHEPGLSGSKRKNQFLSVGSQYGDAPPSKILWISHPPSVIIEEDMLHNAMILFGEIERIKTFSDRNYAFVEFRSVEEARRAKEGLEGKLFNDPRISIEYSSGEFPGVRGPTGEYAFQPVQMDILGLNRPVLPGNTPGRPPSLGIRGPDLYMKPSLGPQSTFEPALHDPELIDLAAIHKLQNTGPQTPMGGPTWRRSSPTPGIISSPSAGFNVTNRSASGAWDVFDANQLQRESKRSRFDAALLSQRTENQVGLDEQYGLHSPSIGGASGSLARGINGELGQRHGESDCIWRGLIAKGGTPVCRARCVPIGEGLGADIPDVVNCSARTGLDLLSKHYEDAIGFDIVFFLPDSEDDFASYTEFLRYLGSRDRAGVAKFNDGTTLFLVPPSVFLSKVLKVSGPERLYGVVLKFPEIVPSSTTMNPRSIHPQYVEPQKMTTFQTGYSAIPPEKRALPLDNSRALPEDIRFPSKPPVPVTSSFSAQTIPPATVASQAGLTLTPELIATLTSLLPTANNGSSGSQIASGAQTSSLLGVTPNVATGPDTNAQMGIHQALDQNTQFVQQLGSQLNSQLQHLQMAQATSTVSNTTSNFHQALNSYSQMHDRTINLTPQGAVSSKPMAPAIPLQSGPISMAPDIDQHYLQGGSHDVLRGQGIDNGTDALRFYSTSTQQLAYPVTLSNQMHVSGLPQPQPYMPLPSERELTHQNQPFQTAPLGVIQEGAETEADKNERYKTTLLFAANLLSRIHQPSGDQPGQGAGSH